MNVVPIRQTSLDPVEARFKIKLAAAKKVQSEMENSNFHNVDDYIEDIENMLFEFKGGEL